MNAPTTTGGEPSFSASPWTIVLAVGIIVLAAIVAYHNCFAVPFIYDDMPSITENRTIRHVWPIWKALSPPRGGDPVAGRPLVNLSLAVNHALGGAAVGGYHALNLAIHILAGLTLFGVTRRTLLQPVLRGRFGSAAIPLALAVAVIWVVHPLQTESVTYVAQRAESLMGMFYLLTVYCFVRGVESRRQGLWYVLSIAACLLGMACKEVMVSAPLIVWLYDRTFVSGSFRQAWRQRRPLYLGLAGTWLLLGYLVVNAGTRGGSVGFGANVSRFAYALTQLGAVVHYLRLSVWPDPLVFDYGTLMVENAVAVAPYALIVFVLLAGTVIGLRRWPVVGFVGCWFFVILAPSSSIVPVATEPLAEHRMYLPLAAVIVLVTAGIHALVGRHSPLVFLAMAVGLGFLTVRRNEDYHSELSIWSDTVAKRPDNPRAHNNLGYALSGLGKTEQAVAEYRQALRINPRYVEAHCNLGLAFASLGKMEEAVAEFQEALRLEPNFVKAHSDLGLALASLGRTEEAISDYREALRIDPDCLEVRNNLGNALIRQGQFAEAVAEFREALRIDSGDTGIHNNLAVALARQGKAREAIAEYEEVLRIDPNYADAHYALGVLMAAQGATEAAVTHYREALRLRPDWPQVLGALAWLLATREGAGAQNMGEAVPLAERLCELTGQRRADALMVLAAAYAAAGRFADAVRVAQQADELARANGQPELAAQIEGQLKLYQDGRPYQGGSAAAPLR